MVLRASGVEKEEPEQQGTPVAEGVRDEENPSAGRALPLFNAALLFWVFFGVIGYIGSYMSAVFSLKATIGGSAGLRSVGPFCTAFFACLNVVLEVAAALRVFSVQRLPRRYSLPIRSGFPLHCPHFHLHDHMLPTAIVSNRWQQHWLGWWLGKHNCCL